MQEDGPRHMHPSHAPAHTVLPSGIIVRDGVAYPSGTRFRSAEGGGEVAIPPRSFWPACGPAGAYALRERRRKLSLSAPPPQKLNPKRPSAGASAPVG